ncbi:MAG: gliding motility protein GldL [Bacteroidota bacterium]
MRPGSKAWKKFMAKLYGIGAAIVIIGALFKIQHWPMAGLFLIIGLATEAVIFFFSAFEPIHEEIDWSLVYPELAGMHGEGDEQQAAIEDEKSAVETLDKMLEEAKIGPELINSLGSGLQNLSDTTSKLSNISDASVATNEFVDNMKTAAKTVGGLASTYNQATDSVNESANELTGAYAKAAKALESISNSNTESFQQAQAYGDQLQKVSKNLAALNASYELQLQGANENLKTASQFYDNINRMMETLNASVSDAQRYKEEISQLSNNLAALNTVYGNMLTAMNVRK